MTPPSGPSDGSTQAAPAVAWHGLTPEEVAGRLQVDPARGLTSAEADARRSAYGPNTFAEAKQASRWPRWGSPGRRSPSRRKLLKIRAGDEPAATQVTPVAAAA